MGFGKARALGWTQPPHSYSQHYQKATAAVTGHLSATDKGISLVTLHLQYLQVIFTARGGKKKKIPADIYLLSSRTEAFSVPSKDDKKEIEKCLSW